MSPPPAAYVLAVLTITWFLAYLDRQIIALLIPNLKRHLHLTDVETGLLQGIAFVILFVVAGLPIGRAVDRHSRRLILVVGVLIWSAATMLSGLAYSFATLFAARMFVGLGEACLAPAAASIIADSFASDKRARAMGTMFVGGAVGTAGSAFLAGSVIGHFPDGLGGLAAWQLTFVAAGLPGILVALLLLTIGEQRRSQPADAQAGTNAEGLLAALRSDALRLVPLYVAFIGNMFAAFGIGAWVPTMLMRDYAMSPAEVGVILGTLLLCMGIVSPILGGWASDLATRRNPVSGRLRLAACMFMAQLALAASALLLRDLELTLMVLAGHSLVSACLAPTGVVLLQESAPGHVHGQVVALYFIGSNIVGMGLGPLFVAVLTDSLFASEAMVRESIAATLALVGTVGLIAMVTALRAGGTRVDAEESPATPR